jgi:hypothetical protein
MSSPVNEIPYLSEVTDYKFICQLIANNEGLGSLNDNDFSINNILLREPQLHPANTLNNPLWEADYVDIKGHIFSASIIKSNEKILRYKRIRPV